MNRQALQELRRLERALARRKLSSEQRRRLQPVIGALMARLAKATVQSAA
jgi:hypothetical protein